MHVSVICRYKMDNTNPEDFETEANRVVDLLEEMYSADDGVPGPYTEYVPQDTLEGFIRWQHLEGKSMEEIKKCAAFKGYYVEEFINRTPLGDVLEYEIGNYQRLYAWCDYCHVGDEWLITKKDCNEVVPAKHTSVAFNPNYKRVKVCKYKDIAFDVILRTIQDEWLKEYNRCKKFYYSEKSDPSYYAEFLRKDSKGIRNLLHIGDGYLYEAGESFEDCLKRHHADSLESLKSHFTYGFIDDDAYDIRHDFENFWNTVEPDDLIMVFDAHI